MHDRQKIPCQQGAVHTCMTVKKSLANRELSTHGYEAKFEPASDSVCLSAYSGHSTEVCRLYL